ncbi:hypothetical protein [Parvibaculum sp.]|uniref:hypothetical protein n=1 Tax=Parvibaculum sp. TaxID=2024848 RepID=UPI003918A5E8
MVIPASTNDEYGGAAVSAWFLVFAGALSVIPGAIHYFLPDGGAGVIAGIDLSQRGDTIVAVFAWMGAMQIVHGTAMVLVGLRYRPLVPLFLLLLFVERALIALDGWFIKGAVSGHHPPEHYASVVALPLIALFFWLSVRPREGG